MDTLDWAEDAHAFFLAYHRFILWNNTPTTAQGTRQGTTAQGTRQGTTAQGTRQGTTAQGTRQGTTAQGTRQGTTASSSSTPSKQKKNLLFFDHPDERSWVLSLVRSSPVLSSIDLSNLRDTPFSRFEEVRGWDVVLRRMSMGQSMGDPVVTMDSLALALCSGCDDDHDHDDHEQNHNHHHNHTREDGRILTLLRRNVRGSLALSVPATDNHTVNNNNSVNNNNKDNNVLLVSRTKWALVECARWALGLYHDPDVLTVIRHELEAYDQDQRRTRIRIMAQPKQGHVQVCGEKKSTTATATATTITTTTTTTTTDDHDHHGSHVQGRGRYVKATTGFQPGDVIWTATPFCCAPLDLGNDLLPPQQPSGAEGTRPSTHNHNLSHTGNCCFHCCRDLTDNGNNRTSTYMAVTAVRDLSLLCEQCGVARFRYCSKSCRMAHRDLHRKECPHLRPLFAVAVARSYQKEEEGSMTPFKALLVLRAALSLSLPVSRVGKDHNDDDDEHEHEHEHEHSDSVLDLECHRDEHLKERPGYAADAWRVSSWIVEQVLSPSQRQAIARRTAPNSRNRGSGTDDAVTITNKTTTTILQNLFFAIHVNAIGIGPDGVGLFPGIPSMFNHSCRENTTHSWDHDHDHDHDTHDNISISYSHHSHSHSHSHRSNETNRHDTTTTTPLLVFRAVKVIQPDDECTIGYTTSLFLPRTQRTQPLRHYKFFHCQCPRCCGTDTCTGTGTGTGANDNEQDEQWCHEWERVTQHLQSIHDELTTTTTTTTTTNDNVNDNETRRRRRLRLWEETLEYQRRLCQLSEHLFPPHFVTKGLCYEQLAVTLHDQLSSKSPPLSLLPRDDDDDNDDNDNDDRKQKADELVHCVRTAMEQYRVCRGEQSTLLSRVEALLDVDVDVPVPVHDEHEPNNHRPPLNDDPHPTTTSNHEYHPDEDLAALLGWSETLFEVKPYEVEALDNDESIHTLVRTIQTLSLSSLSLSSSSSSSPSIQWRPGHRIYEVGFGIRTLILAASIHETYISKHEVAETIQQLCPDTIQNVDVLL